jgi:hypothetical protein
MTNEKNMMKDFPSILNCFPYFLFLITIKILKVFYWPKNEEKKKMKEKYFSFHHA